MRRFSQHSAKFISLALAMLLLSCCLAGCGQEPAAAAQPQEQAQPVTILVAGAWEDCKAIEAVGREFTALYPNCTVQYEYLQDYDAALPKRMTGDNSVDIFFTNNIQAESEMLPYALELYGCEGLDLSNTFEGLIENFEFFGEDGSDETSLYSIPLGAELRGMYVNNTLLQSLGIEMPTDQASFLSACEVLKQAGYIPLHGNPGTFAQTLMYPWVCNLIANAADPQAAYDRVNSREAGLGEMFEAPFSFLYSLVGNGYYDYKRAQTEQTLFVDSTVEAYARDFFNIRQNGDVWEKADDLGQVAFMPSTLSLQSVMDKFREDYHSGIDYSFVLSPVGEDGGFAYMSPARGIAVNKNSQSLQWSVRFIDFLFAPDNNKLFAENFGIIPNTKEAYDYIKTLFSVPDDSISQLGQVTFDYGFYNIITEALMNVSKGNNPKYMQENADGSLSMYPLEYYIQAFEEGIAQSVQ